MKSFLIPSIVALVLAACSLSAAETPASTNAAAKPVPDARVGGDWVWKWEGRDGASRESLITFKQDGKKLSGKMVRGEREPVEFSGGKVTGNQIEFAVVRESARGNFSAKYEGKLEGDTIKGKMVGKMGDRTFDRDWVITRKHADPVGKWVWTMERDNGESWEADLIIKRVDGKLVGEMSRAGQDWKLELQNLAVKGNEISYQTVMNRDDRQITIDSTATLDGKSMKGKSGGSRDGQTWSREWTAKRVE